ncbi:outer membrane protein assembly factor BamC [Oryzomicrobium terrae]|uniref:Outer membrane protein assembly factor BamC n=1 Tax=Oryzomicrobium terrae TaxID=1735038 RepID=A0A5C1E9R5_9RHOO|nr:outer membrane protein assembly factor BamC [Oryzomicrobium terrae]QEL65632.1 outer membrane protein assembly factor BamC [Oryzomicrobium terrae]
MAVAAASGCSVLPESKKIDYKSAGKSQVPSLEIPPDLTAPSKDDRFSVPDIGGKGSATFSAYSAERDPKAQVQNSTVLPQVEKTHIERSGSQRWLVVDQTPDKVWDTVKEFWQETGFIIKTEQPDAGVMETDWAENRAKIGEDFLRNTLGKLLDSLYSTGERDKFRTRLEPGAQPGTTDIFISHRGMEEVYITTEKDQTRWQPRAADPELEAEMLRRLMLRFGVEEKRAEAQIAASGKPVEKARVVKNSDGTAQVMVDERFDRAWRRVGLALDRVGFTVEDRDRSKGLFFVRYVDPEADAANKDPGLLSKLAFWKSTPKPENNTQYRIFVRDGGDATQVQVLTREGGSDTSDTAKRILALLYDQLR